VAVSEGAVAVSEGAVVKLRRKHRRELLMDMPQRVAITTWLLQRVNSCVGILTSLRREHGGDFSELEKRTSGIVSELAIRI
jgi:hypothetical protein